MAILASCKGGEGDGSTLPDIFLRPPDTIPTPIDFTIMGKVECSSSCDSEDSMMISFEDESGVVLSGAEPWLGDFHVGEFVKALNLTPGQKMRLFIQVGSTLRKTQEVDIPKDNNDPIHVKVTLP